MNTFAIVLLEGTAGTAGGGMSFLIMIAAIFVIMYFFMIRPQSKRQKEIQKFRNNLSTGQEIVTAGGIHGTIRSFDETDNTVLVEVASGVKIKFDKTSIFANSTAVQQQAAK